MFISKAKTMNSVTSNLLKDPALLTTPFSTKLPVTSNIARNWQKELFFNSQRDLTGQLSSAVCSGEEKGHSMQVLSDSVTQLNSPAATSEPCCSLTPFASALHFFDGGQEEVNFNSNQDCRVYTSLTNNAFGSEVKPQYVRDYQDNNYLFGDSKIENTFKTENTSCVFDNIATIKTTGHACSTCGRVFARKYNMKQHATIHSTNRVKTHYCSICTRSFYRVADLNRHLKIHTRKGQLAV
ncbi:hypothetical protein HK099_003853 [Clydaea vesicula]|uniref:C2H2-type domain-containing protein n=1 Tax=Clydaea vesicula TaxID=447962 RepID=A0AAD5U147_9FUNG|nr:hypothetical protein HK099_003853 [Clydaea vesicula]